jgi:hypothetical protein
MRRAFGPRYAPLPPTRVELIPLRDPTTRRGRPFADRVVVPRPRPVVADGTKPGTFTRAPSGTRHNLRSRRARSECPAPPRHGRRGPVSCAHDQACHPDQLRPPKRGRCAPL